MSFTHLSDLSREIRFQQEQLASQCHFENIWSLWGRGARHSPDSSDDPQLRGSCLRPPQFRHRLGARLAPECGGPSVKIISLSLPLSLQCCSSLGERRELWQREGLASRPFAQWRGHTRTRTHTYTHTLVHSFKPTLFKQLCPGDTKVNKIKYSPCSL